ncbi:Folate-Biopterin Transporter [Phytophthora megakarya]|uniref:Folate-Biopterin Transporter n=1 Tax=Phytophthora megakarya TaxID=4795 RepID=A0A225WPV3_9STRA|nr:Folate-Biopterin Transporter [Phytophthora megakarya]
MGDAAGESFARGFQYLPVAQMFVAVCPEQQEGVAFALLTSVTNVAQAFSHTISNMLLHIWPVELTDLQKDPHDFSGVWKLSVLTSVIPLIPVLFLTTRMLPKGPRQLEEIRHQLSPTGAVVVIGIYGFGFVWVIVLSMLAIFAPCHVLVGGNGCS